MFVISGTLTLYVAGLVAAGPVSPPVQLTARPGDLRHVGDATLRAVSFVDKNEGWAVGDEGSIWHSIDGGRSWERQACGMRASLRAVHFVNPFTGWVAGREELPGGGSGGVVLFTRDGGLKWLRLSRNVLPGLNHVRFTDEKTGTVAGDGSELCPSGLFTTVDGGRSWRPVPGPRCASWQAADFSNPTTGVLVGSWGRLATVRDGVLGTAEVDALGGRGMTAVRLDGPRGVAVGQGGAVLLSQSGGTRWGFADLGLPVEVRSALDFQAVATAGDHVWAAGRPGSVVLHSKNRGTTWDVQQTGQPIPVHGLCFIDEKTGWAVGALGTILSTADGGVTWTVRRRGGQRAAVLCVHANNHGLNPDTLALLGQEDGYLTAAVRVTAADPATSGPDGATEPQRWAAAVRLAGGACGETLWQFPVPQHLAGAGKPELVAAWDRLHADRAAELLLRQLVLSIRLWQPNVVITDHPDPRVSGSPADALVAEAVNEAFRQAADPTAFPEQGTALGLSPWRADKLYSRWHTVGAAEVDLDLTTPRPRLQSTARDFAATPAALLSETPPVLPNERLFRLLGSRLEGAATHHDLLEGVALEMGGTARRALPALTEPDPEVEKGIRARRDLEAMLESTVPGMSGLADPTRVIARLPDVLGKMPDDQAAQAAFAAAHQYLRTGRWQLARETFKLMVDRYPGHPLTAEACRWLVRCHASGEMRRREEQEQRIVAGTLDFKEGPPRADVKPARLAADPDAPADQNRPAGKTAEKRTGSMITPSKATVEARGTEQTLVSMSGPEDVRRWYQAALDAEQKLAAFGPLYAANPAEQLCVQAARRRLGDFDTASQWYSRFSQTQVDGPFREAALGELWLTKRVGQPPRPILTCRRTEKRPFLDGSFDDPCWQGSRPVILHDAGGDTKARYPTEARFAYDNDFLYLAVRCQHPAGCRVSAVRDRTRDADVRPFDRVEVLLDLDRDYTTYYRLQVDQRGCVAEDCWGDTSWNPRWFVAVRAEDTVWQVEAAVPLAELTGDRVTLNTTWACNIVRVLPGRGVQGWSLPADVRPRPEAMGLLHFADEPALAAEDPKPGALRPPTGN